MFSSHIGPIAIFKVPEAPGAIELKGPYLPLGCAIEKNFFHPQIAICL